jgi:lipopolysaccharide biosynthesis glycosyltransferase
MSARKKPLAFLLGITGNIAFAAGNVALSLNRHMTGADYDIVVYHTGLAPSDVTAFSKIPNVKLVNFAFEDALIKSLLNRLPKQSRFRDPNRLMCLSHYEVFSLLKVYRTVVWLDADTSIQADISGITGYQPFGITLDGDFTVQNNFTQPIDGYRMDTPGYCTAVLVAHDTLPYEVMHAWCYQKTREYASYLTNPDQGIINLALQEFGIPADEMPEDTWQCLHWKERAQIANIVHFGHAEKVWNNTSILNAFPEWHRTHRLWLSLGGADFDRQKIRPRNIFLAVNELEQQRDEAPISNLLSKRIRQPTFRRGAFRALLTRARRLKRKILAHQSTKRNSPALVAFRVTGGVGDHLIAARFIRDLCIKTGSFKYDIFSSRPEAAEWIFGADANLHRCYSEHQEWNINCWEYPLALWLMHFITIQYEDARWREVYLANRKLVAVCERIDRSRHLFDHHIARHPFSDNFLAQEALLHGMNRFDILHQLSGVPYGGDLMHIECETPAIPWFKHHRSSYITIHNGVDEGFLDGGLRSRRVPTKFYPHFDQIVGLIKSNHPAIQVVQLGASTSRSIRGVDLDLVGRTTFRQTAGILRGSRLHIDNESGLVHLAACLAVKSCVLFGPTSLEFFAYRQNINIPPAICGNCWWLSRDWMKECPRGYENAKCLYEINPRHVYEKIQGELESILTLDSGEHGFQEVYP